MKIAATLPNLATWDVEVVSDPTDRALVASIAKGDKQAVRVLFARHKVRIFRFAVRLLGDEAAADDVVSEVFLEIWRNAATFEGRSQVSTWLLGIARNLALTMLRRRSTEELDERIAEAIEDTADNPEVAMRKAQQSAILSECLKRLSPAHREIVDLVYYHEKSINDVADILNIPRNTVKTRLFYARNEIAKLLKGFAVDRAMA